MKQELFQLFYSYTFGRGLFVVAFNTVVLWWTKEDIENWIKFFTLIFSLLVAVGTTIKLYLDISKTINERDKKDK